jgi:DNA-directed RNA polymerase specialized sigma24 family protein
MTPSMTDPRHGAPPFTAKQAAAIRKIARKQRVPARDRDDFVKSVWLEVDRCWAKVPKQEPDTSRYVNGMAYNMACDLAAKRKRDPTEDPVLMSSIPRDFPHPEGPSLTTRIGARQVLAMATARDPQGAEWLVRKAVEDESHASIAASEKRTPDAVRKRIERLVAYLREHASSFAMCLLVLVTVPHLGPKDWIIPGPVRAPEVTRQPPPRDRAEPLRVRAVEACDAGSFARCEALLDEALAIDPAGENDPRVLRARDAVGRAARGELP